MNYSLYENQTKFCKEITEFREIFATFERNFAKFSAKKAKFELTYFVQHDILQTEYLIGGKL